MNRKLPFASRRFEAWPEGDRSAWQESLRAGGLLEESGSQAGLSDCSLLNRRQAYALWLGYLDHEGMEIESTGAALATPERVRTYHDILGSYLSEQSASTYLMGLALVLRDVFAADEPGAILRFAKRRGREARPSRDKRLEVVPIQELYQLGVGLIENAPGESNLFKAACAQRDGLIIALLAARPLRIANLAAIDIGRHLVFEDDSAWLTFEAAEVKNRRRLEFPFPESLRASLDRYLRVFRPHLLSKNCKSMSSPTSGLWITAKGKKMGPGKVRRLIRERTEHHFGRPVTPHLFRDAAATAVAIEDPARVRSASALLGHARIETTERYYNLATSLEASRRYHAGLTSLREAPDQED